MQRNIPNVWLKKPGAGLPSPSPTRAGKSNVERNFNNASRETPEEGPKGTLFFPSLTNQINSLIVTSTELTREVAREGLSESSIRVKQDHSVSFRNRDA